MEQTSPSQESRLHFLDYWHVVKARWVLILTVFLLVLVVVTLITIFKPRIYMAAARIKVEQPKAAVAVFEREQFPTYDPYFLQTQYEIIQSKQILYPVIERLGLRTNLVEQAGTLPMELTLKRLKGQMVVRRYRDTSLIEIAVYDQDPDRAATIANTVAEVFEQQRLEENRRDTQKGIDKLREEMVQQQERLQQAQQKVEQLRKELDVPVLGTAGGNVKLSDLTLQQMEQQLTQARVEAVGRETRLKETQKLTPGQLRHTITTLTDDINVRTLLQRLNETETELEVLKEDYGPDHPKVRSAIAEHDKLQDQIDTRIEGILRGYDVEYRMAQARVTELQRQLDDAKAASLILDSERYLPFRNAQREADLETHLYEAIKGRIQQVTIELEVPRSPVEVIDRAEPPLPQMYVRPNKTLNLSVGAVVGLVLGLALAFFIEFIDTSVKSVEEVEKYFQLPVLGVIPEDAGLICRGEAQPAHIEAYRMLRTNIEFSKNDGAVRTLCVLSSGAGEGKSFTVSNLACVYAQHGVRVLVVDSDLRRPTIHDLFDVPNKIGLTDFLADGKTVDEIIQPTKIPNISVIASGRGGATASALPMLTSQRMNDLIQQVGSHFDIVLFDTPPMLGVSDAAILAREVGTSILVIQHRRYPRNMPMRARQMIDTSGAKLLGVVVNNLHLGRDSTYYYYHDHYNAYAQVDEPAPQPAPAPKRGGGDEIKLTGKY
jgi:succinoglycan biosynthesis transport protein ExoP